jgi:hypothetical protein
MKEIIKYGSYAPSSHNGQMWKVKITNGNSFSVALNPQRILPAVDPKNREAWISIGAFVENCVLSGKDLGYESRVNIRENDVLIEFMRCGDKQPGKYIDLMEKRLTVRDPYLGIPIPDRVLSRLECISENIGYFSKETEQGRNILKYSTDAYIHQTQNHDIMKELSHWIILGKKEESLRRDGLTLEMLGIKGIKRLACELFMNNNSVTGKLFIKGSVDGAKKQLSTSSGFILITSRTSEKTDLVNAGRDMERLWLECVRNNVAVQPMSQVIEEREEYRLLKSLLNISGEVQMVLRLGMVKKYPVRAKRRLAVEEIIEKENPGK